jgi:phage terminase Nu1 subunit (DNA packaging protein)
MSADRYVTREEIAFLLDVDVRTVTNYVGKETLGFPSRVRGDRRTFPVRKCLQWQRDRLVADAIADVAPPAPTDIVEAERRKAVADAELAELKVARMRGDVVAVQAAAKVIRDAFGRVRARLLATPGEFAPQILYIEELPKAVLKLRDLVDTVMAELQSNAGESDVDDESADDGDTDGGPDDEPDVDVPGVQGAA